MQQKYLRQIYLLLILALGFKSSYATITVDSVHVTISTCPNNGTAKVYARSTNSNAVFLFNVVSGPVTYTQQNDSTFYSLYPGNYTGWVHDVNSFDSARFVFTVTGNYVSPGIAVTYNAPLCSSNQDGQIIGHLTPGTGLPPYTWQIYQPDTTPQQVSDTFRSLDTGYYVIRVTDGCGVARTSGVSLAADSFGLAATDNPTTIYLLQFYFKGCDSAQITFLYFMNPLKANLPLRFDIYYNGHVTTEYHVPVAYDSIRYPGKYKLVTNIAGFNYGDSVKICASDTCGEVACSPYTVTLPFKFTPFFTAYTANCVTGYAMQVFLSAAGGLYMDDYINTNVLTNAPVTVTLQDTTTHVVTYTHTYIDSTDGFLGCFGWCINILPQPVNTYLLTVRDTCGHIYQQIITWPAAPQTGCSVNYNNQICMDSTVTVQFDPGGIDSNFVVEIISGPASAHSTDPRYAYYRALSYPVYYVALHRRYLTVHNLPPGYYTYKVYDSCGNFYNGNFNITDAMVTSLDLKVNIRLGCDGLNTVLLTSQQPLSPYLYNIANFSYYNYNVNFSGHVEYDNLPQGAYSLRRHPFLYDDSLFITGSSCISISDTFVVRYYNDSILRTTAVAACNGIINVSIIVDSANGITPFRYAIISGPQVFNFQNSPTFVLDSFGTYLVGVMDSCGNIDARYVTIDTGRFDPIVKTGGWCIGSALQLYDVSSPYYTYIWNKPNGSIFTGDTLKISPFTAADTGIYNIIKVISINGCTDSAFGSYHLVFKDTFQQIALICPGQTLIVGHSVYANTGQYIDTLNGLYGCDSIIYTVLIVDTPKAAITWSDTSLCRTGSVTLTATGGSTYLWNVGQTTPSITVNPQTGTDYMVWVTDSFNCHTTALATVGPPANTTMQITTGVLSICPGDSTALCAPDGLNNYQWSNGATTLCIAVFKAGTFTLTATDNNGCNLVSNTVQIQQYATTQPVIILSGGELTSTISYASYQWYLNGNIITGATGHSLTQLLTGSYTLQATDLNGCTSTSAPYIISGITNITAQSISVSPNPNNTNQWQVTVGQELANAQCQVFDVDGKTVYTTQLTGTNNNIKTNLAAGTYIMRISNGVGIYNIKLVQF